MITKFWPLFDLDELSAQAIDKIATEIVTTSYKGY